MDSVPNLTIQFPGKLVFGKGCLSALPDELLALQSTSVYIVTITPLLTQIDPLVQKVKQAGVSVTINTKIINEPTFADFENLMLEAAEINPDMVLGIGGGSVLDIAKLVAAQLNNTQSLTDIVGIGLLKQRAKKLICVPATSGTGSEVSPNAILVDNENQKKGIISPYLVPDIVYVDPLLTMSVPASITAATGLDALTHCLEAYTNKFAQPMIDMYAFEGMRLIAANITQAVNNGRDEEARTQVAMGSLLGGFCLGPVNTAGVHALSYPLGSSFHLPHGLSNALLLPYVMKFNIPSATAKYAQVAIALGCERGGSDNETAQKGIEKIRQLIAECGIPARLRDVNIPTEAIPQMAEDAMKITRLLKNNPRPITYADAVDIYTDAY
ncbi:alcohol dehydrogenase [Mucilaginibacter sp. PPCGB 2223]|uniref:iron-containing alcohol dehydrogenase n=1 Tax=Mucilaginibacter sp. PPCGB 2223 TaxID=1886027 RepID=UPI000824F28A|nr:iron-containing alcohol dehydrogenase [Mucilaginibacter sp. PPCGB 2223]OCX53030.1 alcohol dehydrogenase [Mucilaginibacter sp. PPCGB 2223]